MFRVSEDPQIPTNSPRANLIFLIELERAFINESNFGTRQT